ncbi:MAG: NUDIX domain-containing protein [Candidatus Komeilibacteria bacterium]|nr:NUDIX domain-containing protein [Candidatus Komeilibacteria bacterium]
MFNTIQTGDPAKRPPTRYDDAEYAKILDGIVIACADIVILDQAGRILMAPRSYEPAKGVFWIAGGRMRFGESFQQAANRNLAREMGIEVDPDRIRPFGTYNYIWGERAQEPAENGSQTVSITSMLVLTPGEIEGLAPNEEYAGALVWRDLKEVATSTTDHPGMIQTAKDLLNLFHA